MTSTTRLTLAVLTILAWCTINATAQDRFKVLAIRGNISTGSGKLSIGSKLSVKDKIVISKGGYTSLVHNNGRTVELKKEGTFKISDLDKAATAKSSNVSGKFASYVVNELTEVKEPISFTDSRKGKMGTTGSVERLDGDEIRIYDSIAAVIGGRGELQALAMLSSNSAASGTSILAIMPRHTRLLDDSVVFVWHRSPNTSRYKLEIVDRNDKVIYSRDVSDTIFRTTCQVISLQPSQLYYWRVVDGGNSSLSSDYYALYKLQGEERKSTEELVKNVKGELDEEDAAVSSLILGALFEDQGLIYDAHRAYQHAMDQAPDIRNYQLLYAEFLRRQNLNMDAYKVLK